MKEIKAWSAFDADTGVDLAKRLREYHIPDFWKWKNQDLFGMSFHRLLDDLKEDKSTGMKPD